MTTKTYYHFGTPQSPLEAMEVLQAVLEYVYQVLADEGLETKAVQPALCQLQSVASALQHQIELECGAQEI